VVNRTSLTFGHSGDERSLLRTSIADVNGDQRPDIVCHFDTRKAAFLPGDVQGILKGLTVTGTPIRGSDSVRLVP